MWLLGIAAASSHYVMLDVLNGQPVRQGTTVASIFFAMLVKFCFGYTIEHAYVQGVWKTIRKTKLKMWAIDTLFEARKSPWKIFGRGLLLRKDFICSFAALKLVKGTLLIAAFLW